MISVLNMRNMKRIITITGLFCLVFTTFYLFANTRGSDYEVPSLPQQSLSFLEQPKPGLPNGNVHIDHQIGL